MSHHRQKHALVARLHELGGRLDEIDAVLQEPHSKDWEDLAIEREGEEVLDRLGAAGMRELARVRDALSRMARGEYGLCLSCGEDIAPARLDAVPETALCAACARDADKGPA